MIIGIAGKAQAGKDTLTSIMIELFNDLYNEEFHQIAFADSLKHICQRYFGLTDEQLWGSDKEVMTSYPKPGKTASSSNPSDYWTPREIMQEVGSFFRSIDSDFWINSMIVGSSIYKNVIVSDVRHLNEVQCIKDEGGQVIKINRPELALIHNMAHESETALDSFEDFDIIVENNGTLDDLKRAALDVVKALYFLNQKKEVGYVKQ